ncbi:hypothetical protein [Jannaschia rubra]|uniref:Uncharacterized protein n=1 Tax=Jannaschia rubra TaxID=282197 RepID=A0A0M6XT90_9RHOB|nr:hypothetical protein [Jannaschia rubra]CTQ33912.1 hypothetical protein JAN5088_02701 [Jannaschia rubra]SFG76058.1 hypothetical protein SAMN04488517_11414 [Jannaschia rubra]
MSKEGERHVAELIRLEGKRMELEDALGRLARDEAEAQEVLELASHVQRLEQEVESARAAAQMEKKDEDMNDTVTKRAIRNMASVDAQLDALAKSMQADGETFEQAYCKALDTDIGRSMIRTREEAHTLATGGSTEADVAAARADLT